MPREQFIISASQQATAELRGNSHLSTETSENRIDAVAITHSHSWCEEGE